MKKLILLSTFFISISVYALPNCPSDLTARWHNCFGTITWPDGEQYVGEWKDDKRHGQGTYTFANGDQYVGEFKEGLIIKGTLTYGNNDFFPDGTVYDGEFSDIYEWMPDGEGTFTYIDGSIYSGEVWVEVRHGKGILTLPNGEIKDGYFRSGFFIPDSCMAQGLKKGSFDFNLCVLKLIEDVPSTMRQIRK